MSNQIILKKSSVAEKVPLTTDLAYGELALNYADGKLYFKNSSNAITSFGSNSATETLSNKTISSPTLTGSLTVGGNTGSNGQFLKSTGTGVVWATPGGSSLSSLSDVALSSPTSNQVLTFNGANWVNAAPNVQIASAVFASSTYDMGYVYDVATTTEDEGLVTGSNNYIYDLGILSFTGIISLGNIDQSIKSDYLGYSIIFGF